MAEPPARTAFRAAVDRVMSLADFERGRREPGHGGFHLERMALLLGAHGDPHLALPTVHVAGSKGKGSVAAMIASILDRGGHRAGLYTSPHLHTVRERIRLGGRAVTEGEFAGLVERAWPTVGRVARDGGYGGVSTFEMMTLMAFLHFRDSGAGAQVIEVGLGGRLAGQAVQQQSRRDRPAALAERAHGPGARPDRRPDRGPSSCRRPAVTEGRPSRWGITGRLRGSAGRRSR